MHCSENANDSKTDWLSFCLSLSFLFLCRTLYATVLMQFSEIKSGCYYLLRAQEYLKLGLSFFPLNSTLKSFFVRTGLSFCI